MPEESDTHSTGNRSHPSSRWLGWTLGLLAAPLLYVLTFPPIFFTVLRPSSTPASAAPRRPPVWLLVYGRPYIWAAEETSLSRPLNMYGAWWRSMLE